jgi:hypothetical protein
MIRLLMGRKGALFLQAEQAEEFLPRITRIGADIDPEKTPIPFHTKDAKVTKIDPRPDL